MSTIADLQEMVLDLVVESEPTTVYWSDTISGGARFPRIAVPVSIHGAFCFDTVLDPRARPARRLRVDRRGVEWDASTEANAAAHDVVHGDLASLLASGGAFDVATRSCLADGDAAQVGSPDEGIAAAPGACP